MPTYKYRCPNGDEFEAIHGMDDPPPTACEICGAAPVTRVFYPISVSFTAQASTRLTMARASRNPRRQPPPATA
jgi:putative FmdB family regulatory protein